ncbi:MAG: hypothetical protein ACLVIY_02745 [Anaerobutyricum soehngenii]
MTTAITPVGSTMYIWGGGWNKEDTGAGTGWSFNRSESELGVILRESRRHAYNYRRHRYQFGAGLDCSGFVGWSIYNIMKTKNGKPGHGYVMKASKMASSFAKYGWGTYKSAAGIKDFKTRVML